MTAPTVVSSAYHPWTGAYPLASSNTFDSTGCDGVLVFFFTASGASWTPPPSCTYDGQTGTLIGQSYVPAQTSAGTLYAWIIRGFSPGSHTLAISQSSNYADSGCAYFIGLTGTQSTPIGNSVVHVSSSATDTQSVNASAANSLFFVFGGDCQAPSIMVTAPGGATLEVNNTTATNNLGKVYSVAGVSSGASVAVTSTAPYNYSSTAVIEVLGAGGGGSPVSITMTTDLSLTVALGGSLSMAAPHVDMTSNLSVTTALGTVTMAAPHVDMTSNLSLSIGFPAGTMAAPHVDVSPLALTIDQLSGEMAAPHLDVGPLPLTLDFPLAEVAVPGLIISGSLSLSLGLGSGDVLVPPVLWADPLSVSLLPGAGTVLAPWAIDAGPLLISLVQAAGQVLTYTPPITADPLLLSLEVGSGVVRDPWAIFTGPLVLDLALGEIDVPNPIEIYVDPLRLSWDRVPKPYACPPKPLEIHVMIGRQLSGNPSVVVG